MATHSSVFAWRIPGLGEPGGLPSMGSHRVGHNCGDLAATAVRERETPGISDLRGSLSPLWTLLLGDPPGSHSEEPRKITSWL